MASMNFAFFANATKGDNKRISELQKLLEKRNLWSYKMYRATNISKLGAAIEKDAETANKIIMTDVSVEGQTPLEKVRNLNQMIANIRTAIADKIKRTLGDINLSNTMKAENHLRIELNKKYEVNGGPLRILISKMLKDRQPALDVISKMARTQCPVSTYLLDRPEVLVAKYYILIQIRNNEAHDSEALSLNWNSNQENLSEASDLTFTSNSLVAVGISMKGQCYGDIPFAQLVQPLKDPEIIACEDELNKCEAQMNELRDDLDGANDAVERAKDFPIDMRRMLEEHRDKIQQRYEAANSEYEAAKSKYDAKIAAYQKAQDKLRLDIAQSKRDAAYAKLSNVGYLANKLRPQLANLEELSRSARLEHSKQQDLLKKTRAEFTRIQAILAQVEKDAETTRTIFERTKQNSEKSAEKLRAISVKQEEAQDEFVKMDQALIHEKKKFESLYG